MTSLRDAASFLTRVPLHRSGAQTPDMASAVPWFPAVGLILGLVQGGIYIGVSEVSTATLAACLATAALALVTGAFHHDGLADMADAFGGGWTPEQRLEILKDSRLGTYGVTVLIFVIVIEIAALSALAGWLAVAATATAHTLSRAVASSVMLIAKPARDSGLGVDYLAGLSRPKVLAGSLAALVGVAILFGIYAIVILIAAYGSAALVVRLAISKIGGVSGDILGAVQQLAKVATLIIIVSIAETGTDLDVLGGLALQTR